MQKIGIISGLLVLGILIFGCGKLNDINATAKKFCGQENVTKVYICGDYIEVAKVRTTPPLDGEGPTFYRADGSQGYCPFGAPNSITEECKKLFSAECIEFC